MVGTSSGSTLTRSVEDYLKAIYELELGGSPAQTSAIASALEVAPPSVSGMVKRLSEAGLLEHVPYRGVQLTEDGRRTALKMVRRHRVVETYLTTKLGYDWDSVHEEAERLEHAVSDGLIERMAMALNNRSVEVRVPPQYRDNVVGFITQIENETLEIDRVAKVVLNEKTGTIIM